MCGGSGFWQNIAKMGTLGFGEVCVVNKDNQVIRGNNGAYLKP